MSKGKLMILASLVFLGLFMTLVAGSTSIDTSGDQVGSYSSSALDSNGVVHVAYRDSTNSALKYCNNSGGSWSCETVINDGSEGLYNSLAIDSNNIVHISTQDATLDDLIYCNNTGGSWSCETLLTDNTGYYSKMEIDSNDKIHIIFGNKTDSNDYYPNYCENTGGSWNCVEVKNLGTHSGEFFDITINSTGDVELWYGDDYYDLFECLYNSTDWNCANTGLSSSTVGRGQADILVDSNDVIHFISADSDLVAYNKTGGSWKGTTLFSEASGYFQSPSADFDYKGNIHFTYYYSPDDSLRYCNNALGSWSCRKIADAETVFANPNGHYFSIRKGRLIDFAGYSDFSHITWNDYPDYLYYDTFFIENYIDNCAVLDQADTTYYLTTSFTNDTGLASGFCWEFHADNITLDMNGNTYHGGLGGIVPFDIENGNGASNITIRNGIINQTSGGAYITSEEGDIGNIVMSDLDFYETDGNIIDCAGTNSAGTTLDVDNIDLFLLNGPVSSFNTFNNININNFTIHSFFGDEASGNVIVIADSGGNTFTNFNIDGIESGNIVSIQNGGETAQPVNTFENFTVDGVNGDSSEDIIKLTGGAVVEYAVFNNFYINSTPVSATSIIFIDTLWSANFTDLTVITDSDYVFASTPGSDPANDVTINCFNCTYDGSKEDLTEDGGDGKLYRWWYYSANVTYLNDTEFTPLENVNITAYDDSSTYQFNLTTGADGFTGTTNILEYLNDGNSKDYYSNYTIYAQEDTGDWSENPISHTLNITESQNTFFDGFQFEIQSENPQESSGGGWEDKPDTAYNESVVCQATWEFIKEHSRLIEYDIIDLAYTDDDLNTFRNDLVLLIGTGISKDEVSDFINYFEEKCGDYDFEDYKAEFIPDCVVDNKETKALWFFNFEKEFDNCESVSKWRRWFRVEYLGAGKYEITGLKGLGVALPVIIIMIVLAGFFINKASKK